MNVKFYVICEFSGPIRVFEGKHPYKYLYNIKIESHSTALRDIAACTTHNCLFVSDCVNKCIWIIDSEEKVEMWTTNVLCNPGSLSVTADGRLLMVNDHDNTIEIYKEQGSKPVLIAVPSKVRHLHHVVETKVGTFYISYGKDDYRLHNVYEITKKGFTKRSYCKKDGNKRLSHPRHLEVDSSDGFLFIADTGNNCIRILDENLSLFTTIPLDYQQEVKLNSPLRTYYDSDSRFLLIGQNTKRLRLVSIDKNI